MEMTVSLTDLFLIVATISIIILMIFIIPLILQVKQTACRAETLMTNLDAKIAETETIIRTAKHAGDSLLLTSKLIRSTLAPAIIQVAGISTGIRAFLNIIHGTDSPKKKESQSDE